MRYLMLIYSGQNESATAEDYQEVAEKHSALMEETMRRGIFQGGDPLDAAAPAAVVRLQSGRALVTDGPFVETKEQLAGYYVMECKDLDEALEWAAKIPTACHGGSGCVEVRAIREIAKPSPPRELTRFDA